MKTLLIFLCCFISVFISNNLSAQENLSSYPANPGEKTYIIKNTTIRHKSLVLSINYAQAKLVETKVGVTGLVGVGSARIQSVDKGLKPFSDSVSHFFIRFNPKDLRKFIDTEKFEVSNQTDVTELFDFYIEAFPKLYHKGNDALIPPVDALATYSKTYNGQLAWVLVDNGKYDVKVYINTELPFKLLQQGKTAEALKEAEALYVKHPDNAEVIMLNGRILAESKSYKMAIPYLLKAIELDTNKSWIAAWAYAYLGKSYFLMDEKDKAREALNKCIGLNATRNVTNFAQQLITNYGL